MPDRGRGLARPSCGVGVVRSFFQRKSHSAPTAWLPGLCPGPSLFICGKKNISSHAFYKTGPDKYLLFFKAGQADAITACFERYSRRLLEQSKSSRIPIREQLKKAAEQLVKEPPKTQERSKEVVREER